MIQSNCEYRPYLRPARLWQPPSQTRAVFADAELSRDRCDYGGWNSGPVSQAPLRGYGLDLDGDGKFSPKRDGYLSFDLDGDGRYSDKDIARSRDILKAFAGDYDSNGDGVVDRREARAGRRNSSLAARLDVDRDGVLSKWELQRAGAQVVTRPPATSRLEGCYGLDKGVGRFDNHFNGCHNGNFGRYSYGGFGYSFNAADSGNFGGYSSGYGVGGSYSFGALPGGLANTGYEPAPVRQSFPGEVRELSRRMVFGSEMVTFEVDGQSYFSWQGRVQRNEQQSIC